MLWVGAFEILVARFCLIPRHRALASILVSSLATTILVYRGGLWWINWHKPCSCLGNLTDALHIAPKTADNIMRVVLLYLLVGSYMVLFASRKPPSLIEGDLRGEVA
jgi:hypothetical protein